MYSYLSLNWHFNYSNCSITFQNKKKHCGWDLQVVVVNKRLFSSSAWLLPPGSTPHGLQKKYSLHDVSECLWDCSLADASPLNPLLPVVKIVTKWNEWYPQGSSVMPNWNEKPGPFLPRTFALEEVFKYCLTEMILLGVFGGFALDENSKPSLAMCV